MNMAPGVKYFRKLSTFWWDPHFLRLESLNRFFSLSHCSFFIATFMALVDATPTPTDKQTGDKVKNWETVVDTLKEDLHLKVRQ
jgi:hypothetical protein